MTSASVRTITNGTNTMDVTGSKVVANISIGKMEMKIKNVSITKIKDGTVIKVVAGNGLTKEVLVPMSMLVLMSTLVPKAIGTNNNGDRRETGIMDSAVKSALTRIPTVGILLMATIGIGQMDNTLIGLLAKRVNLVATMAMENSTFFAVVDGNAIRTVPNRKKRRALITSVKPCDF